MAMITINANTAAIAAAGGIDFEAYIRGGFTTGTVGGGFPSFDNSGAFVGEEMFVGYGTTATSKYVLMHGSLEYNFGYHTVAGVANTIEYGTRGSGSFDSNGYFTGGNVELSITGLDLSNPVPTSPAEEAAIEANGPIHNFGIAHMYGEPQEISGGRDTQDMYDLYADSLDAYAQQFRGSTGNDVYTGTSFGDIIKANSGDDRVAGGGGDDLIYGGKGLDTAVYTGNRADYAVRLDTDGVVHVVDLRTGAVSEGSDQLTDIETLEFANGTLQTSTLAEKGMITIDASAMSAVNFDTYVESYFASLAGGSYKFYGGTVDNYRGMQYYMNGSQQVFEYTRGGSTAPDRLIFEGANMAYDAIHYGNNAHGSMSGRLDSFLFGDWISGTTTGTQGTGLSGAVQGLQQELKISGFGLEVPIAAGPTGPITTLHTAAVGRDHVTLNNFINSYAQHFIGTDGDDVYTGTAFADIIEGNDGDDTLDGSFGADTMTGGLGDDTYYVDHAGDVVVELAGEGNDTVITSVDYKVATKLSIETLQATDGTDVNLTANRTVTTLLGSDGDNRLDAGAGRTDVTGGAGEDTFVFSVAVNKSLAIITDFTVGEDSFELEADAFAALDLGALSADAFALKGAEDADSRIIYRADSGALFYDADGDGTGAALKFAKIDAGLSLSASDFLVV